MSSLSAKAQQQILREQMQAMFPYFIEIETSDFGTFYFVNADEDKTYNKKTYTACCFSIQPPEKSDSKFGDGQITFSAIYNNKEWIKKVRDLSDRARIRVVAAIIYSDGKTTNEIEPIYDTEFDLTNASWNEEAIQWTMKFDTGLDVVMPCDKLDEIICPGIV